jgi:hypothetical protein
MMNCINYCISRVIASIGRPLLQRAFVDHNNWNLFDTNNLESLIEDQVMRSFVMVDLNLMTGESETIPLGDLPYRELNNAHIYDIPLSRTHGRHISVVHAIEVEGVDFGPGSSSVTNRGAHAGMGVQATGTARVEKVGPNMIAVYEHIPGYNTFLRCELENDRNLNNYSQKHWRKVANLCMLATKHLIYARLSDSMGDGAQSGGAPSDYLRQKVDGYADAEELYYEALDEMPSIGMMNDRKQYNRILRLGISGT